MPTPEEVNFYHLASDKDAGAGALHHTLGQNPSQASPGNHTHNGRDSKRIKTGDLAVDDITYVVQGGTLGTQPTFSGDPLFSGSYVKVGSLCHFDVQVDFDNITSFGTGQYYVELPFSAEHAFVVRDGCLHDISGSDQYTIAGHCNADSDQLMLFSVGSNGRDIAFTENTPVNLSTADNFHISGTYHIKH